MISLSPTSLSPSRPSRPSAEAIKKEDYIQEHDTYNDLLVKREWAEAKDYVWPPLAEGYPDWLPPYKDADGDDRDAQGDDDVTWWEGEERGLQG